MSSLTSSWNFWTREVKLAIASETDEVFGDMSGGMEEEAMKNDDSLVG